MKPQSHYQQKQNHTQLLDTIYSVTFIFEYIEINLINNSDGYPHFPSVWSEIITKTHIAQNQSIMHMVGGVLQGLDWLGFLAFRGFSI